MNAVSGHVFRCRTVVSRHERSSPVDDALAELDVENSAWRNGAATLTAFTHTRLPTASVPS
jgi:hypothetical protein